MAGQEATQAKDIRRENRDRLVAFFASGISDSHGPKRLGVEIEHFIVTDSELEPVHYEAHGGLPGVREILAYLQGK